MSIYYGLTSKQELHEHIRRVCQVIKPDNASKAIPLMVGTACAETHFGTLRDRHIQQGRGVYQLDEVRFKDIRQYMLFQRPEFNVMCINEFGIDIQYVGYGIAIDYSPLLSTILCRIGYYMKPEALPAAGDTKGQAAYYKKHWNSSLGKSSTEKYLKLLTHANA